MAKAKAPIPPEGLAALRELVNLGAEGTSRLYQLLQKLGPTFAPVEVRAQSLRKAGGSAFSTEQLQTILKDALGPLHDLRYHLGFAAPDFYEAVSGWLAQADPKTWSPEDADKWANLKQHIIDLLSLETYAVENRGRELLEARPNWVQGVTILADLRPVLGDDAKGLKAMLIVNTLCLQYRSGTEMRTDYFSLDPSDLDALLDQIDLAKNANHLLQRQLERQSIPALKLERHDEPSGENTEDGP